MTGVTGVIIAEVGAMITVVTKTTIMVRKADLTDVTMTEDGGTMTETTETVEVLMIGLAAPGRMEIGPVGQERKGTDLPVAQEKMATDLHAVPMIGVLDHGLMIEDAVQMTEIENDEGLHLVQRRKRGGRLVEGGMRKKRGEGMRKKRGELS